MLVAVPLNGGCSPPAVTDVVPVEAVLLYKLQFSCKGPVMMWKGLVFLWNPVEKGFSDVPDLRFYLVRKCLAPPPEWSISQWDAVILSVPQWDSMAISRRYLPTGR